MALQTFSADDVLARFAELLDGERPKNAAMTSVLRVDGAPRAGKSRLALEAFVSPKNSAFVREGRSHLVVSHRTLADALTPNIISRVGNSLDSRPAKTITALAFKLLQTDRLNRHLTPPKLLNGAEQDLLIRQTLEVHVNHAAAGDDASCATCILLKRYLAVTSAEATATDSEEPFTAEVAPQTTVSIFEEIMTPAFVTQLRDMFARLNELHFGMDVETETARYQERLDPDSRERVEWDLAFALWAEYAQNIALTYSQEFRIDPSAILVEAEKSVGRMAEIPEALPESLVVDDCQDLTLAGYSLLEALASQGAAILLIGNDDESVLSFRGAYPEVVAALETSPRGMNADRITLEHGDSTGLTGALGLVASRVSQAIGSVVPSDIPVPSRPGKLPPPLDSDGILMDDETLRTRIFRTPAEEVDDLVWQVKSADLEGLAWDEMAVIAHDNAYLRTVGRRFEEEGIPVSYSSVTRPLKDEPVVRGLLSLLDLVDMKRSGRVGLVRERLLAVVVSPLFAVAVPGSSLGRTVRFSRIEAAINTLAILEGMEVGEAGTDQAAHSFDEVRASWQRLSGHEEREAPIGREGFVAVLILGDDAARKSLLSMMHSILSSRRAGDPDVAAIARIGDVVETAASALESQTSASVHSALWNVWNECGVASSWQLAALDSTPEAREINRILDSVIRLFSHAQVDDPHETSTQFIERVESLEIEADSLAKVAPRNNTVTLTTPAGALGMVKKRVWIPGLQQQTWPNLTPRNTLFGAEVLADYELGRLLAFSSGLPESALEGSRRKATLYNELKGFLVALTRASETVTLSTVWSEEFDPSEFLFAFMPEFFRLGEGNAIHYSVVGTSVDGALEPGTRTRGGHDVSTRGLVVAARAALARRLASQLGTTDAAEDSEVTDAAQTLAFLADSGVREAEPEDWAFMEAPEEEVSQDSVQTEQARVSLSPSSVDGIWECPLKWSLENRFAGPRGGTVATGFGTLIHACAQKAAVEGWDRSDTADVILRNMTEEYQRLRLQQEEASTPREQYERRRQDEAAPGVLANIAAYFVASRDPNYSTALTSSGKPTKMAFGVGNLVGVEAEKTFSASFSLTSMVEEVAATHGMPAMDAAELFAALSALADGFAADFSPETLITISGRIDRLEHRERAGQEILNIIDYKSGSVKHTAKQIFSDLQLICYQLGLVKGTEQEPRPLVERSLLFDVRHTADPGISRNAPEASFQPALLERSGFNGRFEARSNFPAVNKLFDNPSQEAQMNDAVMRVMESARASGNEQLVWCLTMVARIFYAASYRATKTYLPKKGPQCSYCPFKGICPAWPEESATVFGPSVGKAAR